MFADPQSVTINAVATSLPRTSVKDGTAEYTSADGNTKLTIKQNASTSRFRREVRLSVRKIAADPIAAVNKEVSTSVYLVIDEPRWGFSDTELDYYKDALVAWAIDANTNKVLGGEY
ncbi:TPA_asm: coat protein [ssRNA phage SRR6255733_5]|uniref:Coat protein n=1 Tax=ssRNA phage SRR6255733_5 TaxID=2786501 RepID=A0A8S5L560_9VIRU|nr:coat protein [ssRNA phage SRR6255733_5]DAD52556.1 TPA_asm: coat protein [ssRNA phage SRR6255733_5]